MEGLPEWKRIKPVFDKWNDIPENQVTFTLEDDEIIRQIKPVFSRIFAVPYQRKCSSACY
ncbi:hypothetical protein AALB16_09565 [Lachnospiraceae bacterium 62-35]